MIIRRILCLANSKKLSGRCIAGREVDDMGPGPWIRPVSKRPTEEVSEYERQYSDGSDPRLLDLIDIPLVRAVPQGCQVENWRLDETHYWKRVGRVSWRELQPYIERPPTLWTNGHSTRTGMNDEIPQEIADSLRSSLVLIRVAAVNLHVFAPSEAFGNPKRRVQAAFAYQGAPYRLWVTDPVVERAYLARTDGHYPLGDCCLTVSISEPYQKSDGRAYRYKLIAAILRPGPGEVS